MTNWIEWNGGECPIKSDKTRVEYECCDGYKTTFLGTMCRWSKSFSSRDIIAYRITEDHEPMPMTREELEDQIGELNADIRAQIRLLDEQLNQIKLIRSKKRYYWLNGDLIYSSLKNATHTFDIETINGVPHIHGVAMKEVTK